MDNKQKAIIGLVLVFAIGAVAYGIASTEPPTLTSTLGDAQDINVAAEAEFHEHANFAVFINGEKFDFARPEFMHVKPCVGKNFLLETTYAHTETPEGDFADFSDVIHMHDLDGGVIHVHEEGRTYHDFFDGIGMAVTESTFFDQEQNLYQDDANNEIRFFLNGEEVDDIAATEVRNLDRVLITYGPRGRSEEQILRELSQVPDNACVASGVCEHRGVPNLENCGS